MDFMDLTLYKVDCLREATLYDAQDNDSDNVRKEFSIRPVLQRMERDRNATRSATDIDAIDGIGNREKDALIKVNASNLWICGKPVYAPPTAPMCKCSRVIVTPRASFIAVRPR